MDPNEDDDQAIKMTLDELPDASYAVENRRAPSPITVPKTTTTTRHAPSPRPMSAASSSSSAASTAKVKHQNPFPFHAGEHVRITSENDPRLRNVYIVKVVEDTGETYITLRDLKTGVDLHGPLSHIKTAHEGKPHHLSPSEGVELAKVKRQKTSKPKPPPEVIPTYTNEELKAFYEKVYQVGGGKARENVKKTAKLSTDERSTILSMVKKIVIYACQSRIEANDLLERLTKKRMGKDKKKEDIQEKLMEVRGQYDVHHFIKHWESTH
jgi:hypothetical protein